MAKQVEHNPFATTELIVKLLNDGYVPFFEVGSNSATLALEIKHPDHIRVDIVRVVG